MKTKIQKWLPAVLALILCAAFGAILTIYINPMENVSLNLSLTPEGEALSPGDFDEKGWTVYTQEGDTMTELEPDGYGGYWGIELGQTFYFSRVMEEDLDSPTLQISTAEYTFSVFLDDILLYTDCPDLDNRIGYLTLPMNGWLREDPITITLPPDYLGRTLTIAQSMPEYAEASAVMANPADVMLYCGYSYESGLIAESFGTAILASAAFAVGVILLISFVSNRDAGTLCIALVAFLWMVSTLVGTSFFDSYFGTQFCDIAGICRLLSALALLIFLTGMAGKFQQAMWGLIGVYCVSLLIYAVIALRYPFTIEPTLLFLSNSLPEWIACIGLFSVLIFGIVFWRKDNRFYRLFAPLALVTVLVFWTVLLITDASARQDFVLALRDGQITYLYYRLLPLVMGVALFTAAAEAVRNVLNRRTEKRLMEERRELSLASFEYMRRQHEEVMMLRHDMAGHFRILKDMTVDEQVKSYLNNLIGQNQNIRPVVQSGNEMLDIILNSKLSAAIDAGIKVEIGKAEAPETLPLSDADLCSLVMNIMDNAVTAAAGSGAAEPFIRLDIHVKSDYLAFICENSADIRESEKERKKETVPKHGLGLKIIRLIAERYKGLIDTEYAEDYYKIRVAIPLL